MQKECSGDRINEAELIRKLFVEHFDGLILLDKNTGAITKLADDISGRLARITSDDGTHCDKQMRVIADKYLPSYDSKSMKKMLTLSSIVKQLDERGSFAVNYNSVNEGTGYVFRRITFSYADEAKTTIAMLLENITDIVAGEFDPVTGGYNATGFHNRVRQWIADNPGRKYRVMRYNIDRFRDINGVYGHNFGDKLLRDIGAFMRVIDSPDSFSAHLNADHFVRFCPEEFMSVEECYEHFVRSFVALDLNMPLTLHIGVYDLCEPDADPFTMSYKALLAMQSIKGDMQNHIAYYESGMLRREQEQLKLLKDVDGAIKRGEFEVWFQPQIDYSSHNMFGAEALIRWRHGDKGYLSPAEFIPLLERSNYISRVDKYMIESVCKYMRKWLCKRKIEVSVNLSRHDILEPGFIDEIAKIVDEYAIPHASLHLEVTESAYMQNTDLLIDKVNELRKAGFKVEIDDFGAGYSSLNTLKDIDVDKLKLDMKFLSGTDNLEKEKIIIAAIINMSHTLGLPVIAEGVETREQADMLLGFGCKEMQGYYFSRPVPADEYEKILIKGSLKNE